MNFSHLMSTVTLLHWSMFANPRILPASKVTPKTEKFCKIISSFSLVLSLKISRKFSITSSGSCWLPEERLVVIMSETTEKLFLGDNLTRDDKLLICNKLGLVVATDESYKSNDIRKHTLIDLNPN